MKPLLALTAASLLAVPVADDPVDTWLERAEDLDTLEAEFRMVSASGRSALLHFAYEAPDRCHLRTTYDDEPGMEVWFDGGTARFHSVQDDGSWMVGGFDWGEIGAEPTAWLDALYEAVPSGEPLPDRTAGPIFDLWPDLDTGKVEVAVKYQPRRRSLLDVLVRLEGGEHELTELEDGAWSVALDGDARLELEPRLGLPRGVWFDEDDGERRGLELLALAVDEPLADDEMTPGAAPDGAVDRSEEMARSYGQSLWYQFRRGGYGWLLRRSDDGTDLEGDVREDVVAAFARWHATSFGEPLASRVEAESALFDRWLDKVVEWYEANEDDPEARGKLDEALRGGREGVRKRLDGLRDEYAQRFGEAPFENGDAGTLALLVELEAEGIARAFEGGLVTPVMAHVDERTGELE